MQNKLQVYYQPKANSDIKSLSISYYDFDEQHCTYRYKVVLEKDGEKYKIKKYWGNFPAFLRKFSQIDLSKYPKTDVDKSEDYFYIKFGNMDYITNHAEDIADILSLVHFYEVLDYDISMYKKER
jgi:hypothetical protein